MPLLSYVDYKALQVEVIFRAAVKVHVLENVNNESRENDKTESRYEDFSFDGNAQSQ